MKRFYSRFVAKKFLKLFYWLITALFILILLLVCLTTFRFQDKFFMFIVESGSMEPAIKTGSIVLTIPEKEYKNGDVISYIGNNGDTDMSVVITHRIYNTISYVGDTFFITKGDANNIEDAYPVKSDDVIGRVHFYIPFLGYLVKFAQTPVGFFFTILIPTILIIVNEVLNIKNEVKIIREKRKLSINS